MKFLLLVLTLFFYCNAFLHSPGWYSRGLKESNRVAPDALTLCPSLPEASMTADELASELQSILKQADSQVKAALLEDKSPGGAALSFVYGDQVVWSGGYGLKNMSGEHCTWNMVFSAGRHASSDFPQGQPEEISCFRYPDRPTFFQKRQITNSMEITNSMGKKKGSNVM